MIKPNLSNPLPFKKKKIIALFSGFDDTPILLWQTARARGDTALPILFYEFINRYPRFWQGKKKTILPIGQLGGLINFLKKNQVSHFIIAGKLERLPLKKLSLDLTAKIFLAKNIGIYKKGDDALLSALAKFIAKATNSQLLSTTDYLQNSPSSKHHFAKGLLVGKKPNKTAWQDFHKGQKILNTISQFDIGQGLVIAEGLTLAIEAMAGTDHMIKTCRRLTKNRQAILIKNFKMRQNKKLDAPSIGPDTIKQAHLANITGIFLHHQGNMINAEKIKQLARQYKIFIWLF